MDEEAVVSSHLQRYLSGRFKEGLGLDVSNGASDLRNDDVCICLGGHVIYESLDFIGYVRDHLNGGAQVFAAAFFVENVPVDLTGGKVGILVQILVYESLIVAQIQVGFSAIFGDVYLAVLEGAHGAGIHVDVGIHLLGGHLQTSGFKKSAQRGRSYAFAESGDYSSGNKNIFSHDMPPLYQNLFR